MQAFHQQPGGRGGAWRRQFAVPADERFRGATLFNPRDDSSGNVVVSRGVSGRGADLTECICAGTAGAVINAGNHE